MNVARWYDLINLMQGAVGALIGAVFGGVVAALVAQYTVRGMRKVERQSARELRREEAADAVYQQLQEVVTALRAHRARVSVYTSRETSAQMLQRWRNAMDAPLREFDRVLDARSHQLTGALGDRLALVQGSLAVLHLNVHYLSTPPNLQEIEHCLDLSNSVLKTFLRYLDNPISELRRLTRQDARAVRRARLAATFRRLLRSPTAGACAIVLVVTAIILVARLN